MGAIEGVCLPQFSPVREAFASHFALGWEKGAALCVTLEGRLVVDLWGGSGSRDGERPWRRDTITNIFSTTKGVVAAVIAMLVDEGRLSYDAPVSEYWPEFAANGKESVTLATLLSHQAGLCAFSEPVSVADLYDWTKMVRILEAARPLWTPRERTGYHARTFGFLAGEVIRRVTGCSVGTVVQQRLGPELGDELMIGVPRAQHPRIADIVGPDEFWRRQEATCLDDRLSQSMDRRLVGMMGVETRTGAAAPPATEVVELMERVFTNPFYDPEIANSEHWRSAEIPSSNGHGNARALATLYGAFACGGELGGRRLISASGIAEATRLESDRADSVLGFPIRWARGFTLNGGEFGPHAETFGHRGIGGSFAYADPKARLGVAYTMNQMIPKFGDNPGNDPRADRIVSALYTCL